MWQQNILLIAGSLIVLYTLPRFWSRLRLSRAKHASLRGHSKWSRRIGRLIPYFEYGQQHFFASDGAPDAVIQQRRQEFFKLSHELRERAPQSVAFSETLDDGISDQQFTNSYRVPFPYRSIVRENLKLPNLAEETDGVRVCDLDHNWSYDLSGSYGINVFGYDFYKECLERGLEKVRRLGPVLGPYHPLIRENVERLRQISGLDEVSFHMSGTEAVMQAVRLARYHTGKTHLVRFCGAYHGWWDGVQPGIGNQRNSDDVYTLADLSDVTLKVLDTRKDIACVLVNPLQALHPNQDAASDATLVASDRSAGFERDSYTRWLHRLRDVCTRRGIVMIIDDVFTGFRLAYGGAQDFFDVQADIVTYGKSLGGGLPVGVVCGKHELMKRFKDDQPVNVSFARGTFNSHPFVMATMNEFLHRIELPYCQRLYRHSEKVWNTRVEQLNQRLEDCALPLRVANLGSIWTILYTQPGRYNWMFQFYLRKHGILLSWVGSGRVIMSLNYTDEEFDSVMQCFVDAAFDMKGGGWWWSSPGLTNKAIKRQLLGEMLKARLGILKWDKSRADTRLETDNMNEVGNA